MTGEPVDYEPTAGAHQWHRARFTGAVTCERCHLLPVDPDDFDTPCEPER